MGLLRMLLAMSVFMSHIPEESNLFYLSGFGGTNAVEIFFVISGFYISLILDKTYSSKWKFYKNRALRLYPMYYIICSFVLLRSLIIPDARIDLFSFPAEALAVGTVANSTFLGSDWIMFLQWHNNGIHFGNYHDSEIQLWNMLLIPQSWSIGIEVTFYLLAPILCKAKSRTIIVLGLFLLIIKILAMFFGFNQDPWAYRFFPFEIPMFLLGILIYRLKVQRMNFGKIHFANVYLILLTSYFIFPMAADKLEINKFFQLFILVLLTSIVILSDGASSKDRILGELSYPIYLIHVFVISSFSGVVELLTVKFPGYVVLFRPSVFIPLTLCTTIIMSYILIMLTRPIEKIRDGNRK